MVSVQSLRHCSLVPCSSKSALSMVDNSPTASETGGGDGFCYQNNDSSDEDNDEYTITDRVLSSLDHPSCEFPGEEDCLDAASDDLIDIKSDAFASGPLHSSETDTEQLTGNIILTESLIESQSSVSSVHDQDYDSLLVTSAPSFTETTQITHTETYSVITESSTEEDELMLTETLVECTSDTSSTSTAAHLSDQQHYEASRSSFIRLRQSSLVHLSERQFYQQQTTPNPSKDLYFDWLVGASCMPKRLISQGQRYPPAIPLPLSTLKTCDALQILDGGEDAFFVTNTASFSTFGVADGVGGWNSFGVNPALFAWELMDNAKKAAEQLRSPYPWTILDNAYKNVVDNGKVTAGSSTASIVSLDKSSGVLHSANIGDSGFIVFRLQKKTSSPSYIPCHQFARIHGSRETQHFFNAPYQLSIIPSIIPLNHRRYFIEDHPSDAEQMSFGPLQHGDIVVMGTDGLFDNVFVEEMAELLSEELRDVLSCIFPPQDQDDRSDVSSTSSSAASTSSTSIGDMTFPWLLMDKDMEVRLQERIQRAAELLVKEASELSVSERLSPFGKEAKKHGWTEYCGGKCDDVTVLTALVLTRSNEQA